MVLQQVFRLKVGVNTFHPREKFLLSEVPLCNVAFLAAGYRIIRDIAFCVVYSVNSVVCIGTEARRTIFNHGGRVSAVKTIRGRKNPKLFFCEKEIVTPFNSLSKVSNEQPREVGISGRFSTRSAPFASCVDCEAPTTFRFPVGYNIVPTVAFEFKNSIVPPTFNRIVRVTLEFFNYCKASISVAWSVFNSFHGYKNEIFCSMA